MTTARMIIGSAVHELWALPAGSVDLVVTSPPFLGVRDYLPADHPLKAMELGLGGTPQSFVADLLQVVDACAHVLAPHGSLVLELGDSMAGSGGAGGDYYNADGQRAGQPKPAGSAKLARRAAAPPMRQSSPRYRAGTPRWDGRPGQLRTKDDEATSYTVPDKSGDGWPLSKSHALIPEQLRLAMAYGVQPFSGDECSQWIVRNVVRWCKPNPSVGDEGDKFRRATTDMVVATRSPDRYWDKLGARGVSRSDPDQTAPLYDWWEQPTGNYRGAHFATFPLDLVAPLIDSMCPHKVCTTCGEPQRRLVKPTDEYLASRQPGDMYATLDGENDRGTGRNGAVGRGRLETAAYEHAGWTDCGHDTWRAGVVLDPFAGTGTTLASATGRGRDAIGLDLNEANVHLAEQRMGMFLAVEHGVAHLAAEPAPA